MSISRADELPRPRGGANMAAPFVGMGLPRVRRGREEGERRELLGGRHLCQGARLRERCQRLERRVHGSSCLAKTAGCSEGLVGGPLGTDEFAPSLVVLEARKGADATRCVRVRKAPGR